MITKRAIGMLLVSLTLLVGSTQAQAGSTNDSLAARLQQQPELRRELGLTPKQETKLTKLVEWEQNDIRLIGQKRMISQAKRDALIREAREKSAKQVRALLSAEQLGKLESKQ